MVTDQTNKWQTECLHVAHGYWPDQHMTNWVSARCTWLLTRPTHDKLSVCTLHMVTDQTNTWQTVSAHCTWFLTRPTNDKLSVCMLHMVPDQTNTWQTECLHIAHGYWPDQHMTNSVCTLHTVPDQTNTWQTECLHVAHGSWPDQHMTNWVSAHCTYQSINLGQVLGSGICWPQVVEPRLQGPYWNTGQAAGWTPVHWTIFIPFPPFAKQLLVQMR